MKDPLKPGDRVCVYEQGSSVAGIKGTVHSVGNRYVQVLLDEREAPEAYFPQQCRRLRKREKPVEKERVERWVVVGPSGKDSYVWGTRPEAEKALPMLSPNGRVVRFTELRHGEAIVSRTMLAEAMVPNGTGGKARFGSTLIFDYLCEALGIHEAHAREEVSL